MMDTEIDRSLLEKIADLIGKPVGAFNIRKDSGCDGRQSTEQIEISSKEDKRHPGQARHRGGDLLYPRHHYQVRPSGDGLQRLLHWRGL